MAFPIKKKTVVPPKTNLPRQAGGRRPGPFSTARVVPGAGMTCPGCGMQMSADDEGTEGDTPPAPEAGKSQQVKNVRNMITKLGMKKSGNSGNPGY